MKMETNVRFILPLLPGAVKLPWGVLGKVGSRVEERAGGELRQQVCSVSLRQDIKSDKVSMKQILYPEVVM